MATFVDFTVYKSVPESILEVEGRQCKLRIHLKGWGIKGRKFGARRLDVEYFGWTPGLRGFFLGTGGPDPYAANQKVLDSLIENM